MAPGLEAATEDATDVAPELDTSSVAATSEVTSEMDPLAEAEDMVAEDLAEKAMARRSRRVRFGETQRQEFSPAAGSAHVASTREASRRPAGEEPFDGGQIASQARRKPRRRCRRRQSCDAATAPRLRCTIPITQLPVIFALPTLTVDFAMMALAEDPTLMAKLPLILALPTLRAVADLNAFIVPTPITQLQLILALLTLIADFGMTAMTALNPSVDPMPNTLLSLTLALLALSVDSGMMGAPSGRFSSQELLAAGYMLDELQGAAEKLAAAAARQQQGLAAAMSRLPRDGCAGRSGSH